VLSFLAANQDRVVSKQELLDAVWPDVAVTEDSLVQCLIDIRKALGEQGRDFIRTVPRRGYICQLPAATESSEEPVPAPSATHRAKRLWALGAFAAALAISGVWVASGYLRSGNTGPRTLLVLPFETIPPGEDDGWMGLGLADLLITRLSNLGGVVVRPTSAVSRYVDVQVDPLDAGRAQRVDYVLAGSIRSSQDDIRASVRLWSIGEGKVVWTKAFAEPEMNVLDLEDAISARITEALELHLTTEEQSRLSKRPTTNPEAMALYQRGLHQHEQGTRAATERAVKFFKAAIEADPKFANAYVALADAYLDFSSPLQSKQEAEQQVQMLLQKALALDDDLADAHAAMAEIKQQNGDFAGADAELSRALSLNPNSIPAIVAKRRYLMTFGEYDQAMEYARRWCDLDPLSSRACELVPTTDLAARRYDRAIEGLERILESDPAFAPARTGLGAAYIGKRLYPEAIAQLETVLDVERAPERVRFCLLAFAYARNGQTAQARSMLAEMERAQEQRFIRPQFFAVVYAGLGENDLAFEWLDRAYPDRPDRPPVNIELPTVDIALEVLKEDPRYHDFWARKGLAVH
jgi:tetratricopeptide (TPR) repeat protein